ncbi:unnamed protein product [Ceratitis capitata]|uniref:(Mediterranean fruit fly) hypothetical protein n=1 Tax=Ceratitis capitata TaxID=7213 RepID=A0A811UIX7_CERCA|nr:unnamed protein product [Ceratitis capitata]
MASKRKEISVDERNIIIKFWQEGKSNQEIGCLVGRSHCSIYTVIKNFKSTGIITSKARSGRPPKLTVRESRSILSAVKKNPRLTALSIAQDVQERFAKNISVVTARRILRWAGFHSRVA